MKSEKNIERETSRIAMQFWPRAALSAFVVVALAGCATTTSQVALNAYCEMSEDEREVVRERIQERCDARD